MRWDVLIQDLSDRLEYLSRQDGVDMVPELVRAERAGIEVSDRLIGSLNCDIAVTTQGGSSFSGRLDRVEDGWVLLTSSDAASRSIAIPFDHIHTLHGLSSQVNQLSSLSRSKLSFLALLRQLAKSRLPVSLVCGDEVTSGYIVAVGKDWLDLRSLDAAHQVTTFLTARIDAIGNHALRTVH